LKIIHTSDWHIGRFFQSIPLLEDQLYVLAQIRSYIKHNEVDVLVVSGDIFDRSVPPAEAVEALNLYLDDITSLGVEVIMISGNHDSAKRLSFGANQMRQSGLTILSKISEVIQPVCIEKNGETIHFYGIPYHDPVEVAEQFACDVKTYDEAHTYLVKQIIQQRKKTQSSAIPSILISHCFIDGAQVTDSERPLSVGGAEQVSWKPLEAFDYVALGHLHGPQYKGKEYIRYSGSLLKYSFSEHKQKKGVMLVEINKKGIVSFEHLPLLPRHDLRIIKGSLEDIIEQGKNDPDNEDYVQVCLIDEQAILDPMGQLRKVYPNILQIEKTNFTLSSGSDVKISRINERDESEVFHDFFQQVMGQELSQKQTEILQKVIKKAQVI